MRESVRQHCGRQGGAILKRSFANLRETVGQNHGRQEVH